MEEVTIEVTIEIIMPLLLFFREISLEKSAGYMIVEIC